MTRNVLHFALMAAGWIAMLDAAVWESLAADEASQPAARPVPDRVQVRMACFGAIIAYAGFTNRQEVPVLFLGLESEQERSLLPKYFPNLKVKPSSECRVDPSGRTTRRRDAKECSSKSSGQLLRMEFLVATGATSPAMPFCIFSNLKRRLINGRLSKWNRHS